MPVTRALTRRLDTLPGYISEFGVFIDTHRDQPHIGSFHKDIHRGKCRPTAVAYDRMGNELVNIETGDRLTLHDKHAFVENDWFTEFLIDRVVSGEGDPRDAEGMMPTALLRDPRHGLYKLRSFRQIAMAHYRAFHP